MIDEHLYVRCHLKTLLLRPPYFTNQGAGMCHKQTISNACGRDSGLSAVPVARTGYVSDS